MIITNDTIKEATLQAQSNIGNKVALDAGNKKSYPGSGSTWFDISGNDNHCNLADMPTFESYYFDFDGNTNYGSIANSPSANILGFESSFEIWMRVATYSVHGSVYPNTFNIPIFKGPATGYGLGSGYNGNYCIWFGEENFLRFASNDGTNGEILRNIEYKVPDNQWLQLFVTQDSSGYKYYVNSSYIGGGAGENLALNPDPNSLLIGKRSDDFGYMLGKISVINIWDRKLSDAEIKSNYDFYRQRFGLGA
jgi:hypothetical protein